MAFARLDVYWHDGRLESYLLTDHTVSVGRAPGNTIALDTDTISRYHFSIVREDDVVTLTDLDSANGTFIDGVQLASNHPHVLDGVEEIQIGQLRMIYTPLDETPTVPMSPIEDDETQRIIQPHSDFIIDLDLARIDVWPAASSSAELSITNTSGNDMNFEIGVDGMPARWVRVNRGRLFVPAGETSRILINIKTPRRPDVQPLVYHASIQVQSEENPTLLEIPLEVHIQTYRGFGIALHQHILDNDETTRLYLHNQGNAPTTVQLRGYSADNALLVYVSQGVVTLEAGQRTQVEVRAKAHHRAITGAEVEHTFDIRVHSQDDAHFTLAEAGKVVVKPMLPLWGVISIGGIALSVVLVILFALLGLLSPDFEPTMTDLTVNTTRIAQGDSLDIAWSATEIAVFDVYANGTPITTLDGDARAYELDTSTYAGDVDLLVIGTRGEDEVRLNQNVFVYVPMAVASFTVNPDPLMRNVVTAIDVAWNVPGAVLTRISGLEAFTTSLYQAEHGASANLLGIGGVAKGALTLSLYAEDEVGNVLEESLVVDVLEPTCTADQNIALREGPDNLYQQVGNVSAGSAIVVEAQDATSGWFLTTRPGNVRAWAERDGFTCADNFDPDLLTKEYNLPPTPTVPASPTLETKPTLVPSPTFLPTQDGRPAPRVTPTASTS